MEVKNNTLTGRKALVTGANSGIGEAIARRFAAAGAAVVINYRSRPEAAQKIVEDIAAAGGKAIAIQADVRGAADIEAMFAEMFEHFGGIDILVNNAGIINDRAFLDMSIENWDKVININLRGAFICAQQAARQMAKAGGGAIVNISSVHQTIPAGGNAHYCTSKGGLEMLMKTMALELAQHKIRVNNIAPGAIATPINEEWLDDAAEREKVLATIPWRSIGTPEDIAAAALYLVSDEAKYVTGTTLFVDGGMTLYADFLGQT